MLSAKELRLIFSGVGALGGVVAVVAYFENKKTVKLKNETAKIEHEIKTLELQEKKDEKIRAGYISTATNPATDPATDPAV